MTLCEVKDCPCYATHGAKCAAHASTATKVNKLKAGPAVICKKCGDEIKHGDWQKFDEAGGGMVHGGYACQPKP